jgi:maltooligosyltrehalose trehalohydrolase
VNGMRFGPRPARGGGFEFRLWAPKAKSIHLVTSSVTAMTPADDGWFSATLIDARAGMRYRFRVDGDSEVPDPASAYQPDDVFGPSEVIDHQFDWCATEWRGRPWHEAVILELHVGTFTTEGTFRSAIERLDHVVEAGFTAIELMPVADFAGRWNWGYDGVLWFAPDSAYGRPEDLRALVDGAHCRGLMVFLDVVYNHFGPEGNYLPRYAPQFFAANARTPWGSAIDFNVPQVRSFAIENALHWLTHYRFDGLRLDAVHAIVKPGMPSILEDISKSVGRLARAEGRAIHLVLENDSNEAGLLDPLADPPNGKYRAQWNDDFHHAWHVLLTGEKSGYYQDFASNPLRDIACVLKSGFRYQGEPSAYRGGARRGEPSGDLPPTAFVSFLQNHDQIGNRAFGERLDALAQPAAIEAALAVMLLSPMPPMLFMGEEWGEDRPFPFFCDFRGELAEAVRAGRRREFEAAYAATSRGGSSPPDPLSKQTFLDAKIDWNSRKASSARRQDLVRRLLKCRAKHITPRLVKLADRFAETSVDSTLLSAKWRLDSGVLHCKANLGDRSLFIDPPPGKAVWGDAQDSALPPWSTVWTWED